MSMVLAKFGSPQKPLRWGSWTLYTYITEDNSCVVTRKSVQRIFGFTGKSEWLADFLDAFKRFDIISPEFLLSVQKPLLLKIEKASGTFAIEEGYACDLLFDICRFIIRANNEGYLSVIELKIAKTAQKVLDTNNAYPLALQIEENSGFSFYKDRIRRQLTAYIIDHDFDASYNWITAFPDSLWMSLFDFVISDWPSLEKDPAPVAAFITKNIFGRLGALLEEMRRTLPKRSYRSKTGKSRSTGLAPLDDYLKFLQTMMGASGQSPVILEQLLEKSYPVLPQHAALQFREIVREKPVLSSFDRQLQKSLAGRN